MPNFDINEFFSFSNGENNSILDESTSTINEDVDKNENNSVDLSDINGIQNQLKNNEDFDCNMDGNGLNENNGVVMNELNSKNYLFFKFIFYL